jgi:hypothetical protein
MHIFTCMHACQYVSKQSVIHSNTETLSKTHTDTHHLAIIAALLYRIILYAYFYMHACMHPSVSQSVIHTNTEIFPKTHTQTHHLAIIAALHCDVGVLLAESAIIMIPASTGRRPARKRPQSRSRSRSQSRSQSRQTVTVYLFEPLGNTVMCAEFIQTGKNRRWWVCVETLCVYIYVRICTYMYVYVD